MLPARFAALILLFAGLPLMSCGSAAGKKGSATGGASSSVSGSNLTGAVPVAITSIFPGSGVVASLPASVTVNFSAASLDQASLAAVTNFTVSCGGNPIAAQSVSYVPGVASVTANFSAMNLAGGTTCAFQVSAALRDGAGNIITGNRTATYTIQSQNPAGWVPAAIPTLIGPVGSTQSQSFSGLGINGMILQGLLLNGGQYVDGVVGIWANLFSSNAVTYGQAHGAGAGGYTQMSCPAGYRVTGIYGKAGVYIDSIGIICKTEDYSQTYYSALFGGAGGIAYELECPAGQFATDLNGHAGSYLDQLSLGCR